MYTPPKVKETALAAGIPVYQPEKVKTNEEFYQQVLDKMKEL